MPVKLIKPRRFGDDRGWFVETYNAGRYPSLGVDVTFVQDNHSMSRDVGTLRGLHYQAEPHGQDKLIRCVRGAIWDVAVDVRRGSPHFGQWLGVVLDDVSHRQLWIPPGFAHGFCVLSEEADFAYMCTDYYHPQSEAGVLWNDPALGIQWPDVGVPPQLSDKDRALPTLAQQTRLPDYRAP